MNPKIKKPTIKKLTIRISEGDQPADYEASADFHNPALTDSVGRQVGQATAEHVVFLIKSLVFNDVASGNLRHGKFRFFWHVD